MSGGLYPRLLSVLRPHAGRMVAAIVTTIGAAVLDVFSLTLLIPFLDRLFGSRAAPGAIHRLQDALFGPLLREPDKMAALRDLLLVVLAAVAAKNLLLWLANQLGAQLQEYVTRDLRDALYAHVQRLPLAFFTRTKTGQILTRVMTDTAQTKQIVTQTATQSLQSAAVVLATVVALFYISWRLALIALVIAPMVIGALHPLLRRLRTGYRALGDQYGEMASIVQEVVSGIRLVKSYRGEHYEESRFRQASRRYARAMVRVTRVAYLGQPVTETVGTLVAVILLWVGARQVLVEGTLSGSTLIAFLVLVMRLLQPLKQLSQVPVIAQASLAAAERIFEVLDEPSETTRDRGTRAGARLEHALAFDRVRFAYDGEPVLVDVTFEARKGQIVALVGSSGAGKSTLVDLIPRFYEPTAGRILLDGVDTREFRLAALRALTGIVSQDTVLFNDSVRNNIAYAAGDRHTDAEIEAAARAANAHEFIAELPDGYATLLGERGARLSGGQRQRIAIARALLMDPPILVLDEATSALDTQSERLVQQAIDRLLAGRTVFVIAHRLSTVVHADLILVLERGRIAERGTHAELLARRGVYHRLHELQFAAPATAVAV